MSIANKIFEKLEPYQFSYGDSLSLILEHNGKAITNMPNEDFVFPDRSVIRLSSKGIQLIELLEE